VNVAKKSHSNHSIAKGMMWVSHITTVSLMMVVPILIGWGADVYFDILPWLTLVGALFGMSSGLYQLLKLANPSTGSKSSNSKADSKPSRHRK